MAQSWAPHRSINTVTKLLVGLGSACETFLDDKLMNFPSTRIECDEIWAFCYSKERNVPAKRKNEVGMGDVWTWVALDPDTKLVATWLVGERDALSCNAFIKDLASRLRNRVSLTTDGYAGYPDAVERTFGEGIDYAQGGQPSRSDQRLTSDALS